MEAKLEFSLPEDEFNLLLAIHSHDLYSLVYDIDQMARAELKHGDISDELDNKLQEIRDMIWNTVFSELVMK